MPANRPGQPRLLQMTGAGLFCARGGFHIDPQSPVSQAIITHAHADHACRGSRSYLTAVDGMGVLRSRIGPAGRVQGLAYGQPLLLNGVQISLHPAGHILGSSQVRVEADGEVWVVTGDYKCTPDVTCAAFEPVRCHTLITESTFAHPAFRWPDETTEFAAIDDWWRMNQSRGVASFLYAYSLGKAQRILARLHPATGPIVVHPEVARFNAHYVQAGVALPECLLTDSPQLNPLWNRALFILPPNARWRLDFPIAGHYATAFASGWMQLPNGPQLRRVERGFVISDHVDQFELQQAIRETGCERVIAMHGYTAELVDWATSHGLLAEVLPERHSKPPPRLVLGPAGWELATELSGWSPPGQV